MYKMQCDVDPCASTLLIWKRGLMLEFVKMGDSLLMSFMKFSHTCCNLSCMRLLQFNFNTEITVSDGFQECSHMNTSINTWVLLCHF
jgi:hypothetical protein